MCPAGGAEREAYCPGEQHGQGTGYLEGLEFFQCHRVSQCTSHHSSTTSYHSKAKPNGFYCPAGVRLRAQRYSFIISLSCSAVHTENAGFGDFLPS